MNRIMKRILLLANRDFTLYNFRFELIERLISEGYDVFFSVCKGPKVKLIEEIGAKYCPIEVNGRGTNPIEDLSLIKRIFVLYETVKPDVILLYTTKMSIYGGILARLMRKRYLINVSGLGTAVGQKNKLQTFTIQLYKAATKRANCVFFQNQQNMNFFHERGIACKKEILIPGSGVNVEKWNIDDYPGEENGINFLFIARIIREKGIEEYLEVAKRIKKKNSRVHFGILGPIDGDYEQIIKENEKEGIVKYYGEALDTKEYLKQCHCLIHPSYYPEGISNVCLEAASCQRPVITTNNPGCVETVDDGVTGYIAKIMDVQDLEKKVEEFISISWDDKKRMGEKGRIKVNKEFNRKIVTNCYLKEIGRILEQRGKRSI